MYTHSWTPQAPVYRELDARYASACGKCDSGIRPGERVANTGTPKAPWAHIDCLTTVAARKPEPSEKAAHNVSTEPGLDLGTLAGSYAVENAEGNLTFIQVDRPADGKWAGWSFVRQQLGPNMQRLGAQRPGGTYRGVWAALLAKVLEDPQEAMRRYGLELGRCGHCHLELTNAESRAYGIGPVCRKALGW
jgi:hypothetical protein